MLPQDTIVMSQMSEEITGRQKKQAHEAHVLRQLQTVEYRQAPLCPKP